nr:protein ALP1-like isoform X1 [Tanacetum cinerariifolium]
MTDIDDMEDIEMIMEQLQSEQEQQQAAEWVQHRNFICRECLDVEDRLMADYFGPNPKYPLYYFRKRNCPKSWHGQFARGDKKYPTIMLEAVASYNLRIWHAFLGVAGANNDLTILNNSPLFDDLLDDIAPVAPFECNGIAFKKRSAYHGERCIRSAYQEEKNVNEGAGLSRGRWLRRRKSTVNGTLSGLKRSKNLKEPSKVKAAEGLEAAKEAGLMFYERAYALKQWDYTLERWIIGYGWPSDDQFACSHWVVVNSKGRGCTQSVKPELALTQVELPIDVFSLGRVHTKSSYLGERKPRKGQNRIKTEQKREA